MSAMMNGYRLIGQSRDAGIFGVGARFRSSSPSRIPVLTREQVAKYATFPDPEAKPASTRRPRGATRFTRVPRKITPEDVARTVALWKQGKDVRQIAKETDRWTVTVRKILRENGIEPCKRKANGAS